MLPVHRLILDALAGSSQPMPVPEVVARTGLADAVVRLELRVLHGQLRVRPEGGGWRLLALPPGAALANLAASCAAVTHGLQVRAGLRQAGV